VAGPRQVVDGPSFTRLPFGLWDAVQKPTPEGSHWQNGITWVDQCPTGDTVMDECIAVTGTGGSPTAQQTLSSNVVQTNRGATSFTVYAEFDCSPVGLTDAESIASTALDKVEQWQVERAFWTGVAGKSGSVPTTTVFPHLAANTSLSDSASIVLQPAASVVATGSGDDLAITLGELEAALDDCYHGQGLIHMPREAAPSFFAWKLLEEDDNSPGVLRTRSGHRVVLGSGYTGSGPDGAAAPAGTSWIYGTGAVFGYRSGVDMASPMQSFDRVENTYRMIAQRTYVLGFECCLYAARVNLGVPT
jgi:hypothetical protein